MAVRPGPRVPGERLRAAEEHQPVGVPEPEQQQPGRRAEVSAGAAGRLQPEHRDRRRRREKQRRGRSWTVDQAQQIVRERRTGAARQHAQRDHTVARRPETETVAALGPALQQRRCTVQRRVVVVVAVQRTVRALRRIPVRVQRVVFAVQRVVFAVPRVDFAVRQISVPVPRPPVAVQRIRVQERQRNIPGKPVFRRPLFVQRTDVLFASAQSR